MLNQNRVLKYIKDELGFPFMQLEFEDEVIIESFITYSLREFSGYIPEVKKIGINLSSPIYKVPGRQNEFYISDPQNIEILNVKEIYFGGEDHYINGHPYFGPMSHFELREWALQTEMANQLKMFSSFDKTFEFSHPNIIRISPIPNDVNLCIVEYERMQPEDLRGIPNEFQILFCNFAAADIMIKLGRIRKKYTEISTPFGRIPLSEDIFEEGKEKKREIIEKLERLCLPNMIIDHG